AGRARACRRAPGRARQHVTEGGFGRPPLCAMPSDGLLSVREPCSPSSPLSSCSPPSARTPSGARRRPHPRAVRSTPGWTPATRPRARLRADAYQVQSGFKSGERVDAVIKVDRLAPIDAKFPLDNFERLVDAEDDAQRELYEKAFARDVKGHIDAIAGKYIRP